MVKKENGNKWTSRPKATVLRQEELERQREELLRRIAGQKKEIADLEQKRERYAEDTLRHNAWASPMLDRCLEELRNTEERVEVWEGQLERVEKQIERCEPTREEAAEQEKNQNDLAALAEERFATDQQIHKQLGQLSSLLEKRRGASRGMAGKAQALGAEIDLDQDRFDALLSSLPTNVLVQSESWLDWLFGRQKAEVRAVARERLERRETLVHTGIYNLGDAIELSQAEFDRLHRTDRPAQDNDAPWRCQPPSVFSLEEYESARAEAEENGVPLEEILVLQDVRRFHEDQERYHAPKRAAEARAAALRLGTPVRG